jgi:hypothetical protein
VHDSVTARVDREVFGLKELADGGEGDNVICARIKGSERRDAADRRTPPAARRLAEALDDPGGDDLGLRDLPGVVGGA